MSASQLCIYLLLISCFMYCMAVVDLLKASSSIHFQRPPLKGYMIRCPINTHRGRWRIHACKYVRSLTPTNKEISCASTFVTTPLMHWSTFRESNLRLSSGTSQFVDFCTYSCWCCTQNSQTIECGTLDTPHPQRPPSLLRSARGGATNLFWTCENGGRRSCSGWNVKHLTIQIIHVYIFFTKCHYSVVR